MASFIYNEAKRQILANELDLETADIRVMLVNSTYVANADEQFLDEGGADDAVDGEITSVTNYARKALANKSITKDNTNDRAVFTADDVTWTDLGGAANDTVVAAVFYVHTGTDTTATLVAYGDINDFTTDGNTFILDLATAANGGVCYI